jgi:hypothetical protein
VVVFLNYDRPPPLWHLLHPSFHPPTPPFPFPLLFQAALKVHEDVELAKKGVNATFSQLLLDADTGKEAWVSRTTVLVPARHRHHQEKAGDKNRKPTTLVEDAQAEGCVRGWGGL